MPRRLGKRSYLEGNGTHRVANEGGARLPRSRAKTVVVGLACAAFGFAAAPIAANAAQQAQAFITNDDAHPVPVKGTVNVGNTVPVTGTVTVANQPSAVMGEPLSLTRTFQVSDPDCTSVVSGALDLYTVPAGKRLILDHASVSAQVLDNGYTRIWLSDGSARFFIPTAPPLFDSGSGAVGFGYATGTDSPNAVIAGGATVSVHMTQTWRNGSNNLCSVTHYVTITGRLVS